MVPNIQPLRQPLLEEMESPGRAGGPGLPETVPAGLPRLQRGLLDLLPGLLQHHGQRRRRQHKPGKPRRQPSIRHKVFIRVRRPFRPDPPNPSNS